MQASQRCIDLIKVSEGLRLVPYKDLAGNLTVGYGHKLSRMEPALESISASGAGAILAQDIARTERQVFGVLAGIGVTQGQFDALCSFAFNLGIEALAKSTLLVKLKVGDIAGAADEFARWDHVDGVVEPGLVTRRAAERTLFLVG